MDKEKLLKLGGVVVTGLGFVLSMIGNVISEKTQKIEIRKAVQEELPKIVKNNE